MPVPLFSRRFGDPTKPPLVILHGLLGSSRNWQTVARELGDRFDIHALDLRNHGDSPHSPAMNYAAMVGDVCAWADAAGIARAAFLGHSMGGKAAMLLATQFPARVEKLVVLDIAPRAYRRHNAGDFDAMNSLDLEKLKTRAEADAGLEKCGVSDWAMRQFLLTNLIQKTAGDNAGEEKFVWKINLKTLTEALGKLSGELLDAGAIFPGKTLFIRGGKSDFIRDEDFEKIRRHFPAAEFETIAGAGHNPHIDARPALVEILKNF